MWKSNGFKKTNVYFAFKQLYEFGSWSWQAVMAAVVTPDQSYLCPHLPWLKSGTSNHESLLIIYLHGYT